MKARRLLSNLLPALCLTACATAVPLEPAPLPDEARRLIALLTLRRDEFSDLRTLAEVTVRRGATAQRLSGVLLVKPPASLRFEALSPFGQPFLLLTIADAALTTYDVAENQSLSGPVDARTTGRWLGVPLDADDLVGLLIGRVIPPAGLREAEILPVEADGPSLRLVGRDRSQRVWMDFETGEVLKTEVSGGRTTLVVTYQRDSHHDLPTEIRASAAGEAFEATVRYRQPAIATGLGAEQFGLTVPQGANIQRFH